MSYEVRKALVLVTGGLLVGGGVGYILARHRLEKQYRDMANEEIASIKDAYKRRYKEQPYSDPTSTAATLIPRTEEEVELAEAQEISEEEGYTGKIIYPKMFTAVEGEIPPKKQRVVKTEVEVVEVTIDETFDMPDPDPDHPYLITVDEYMEDETFDKITLEYYEEDDTLADEQETIVPDIEGTVGQANLLHFGRGSKDKNVVYVRNQRLRADFEVCRDEGSFAKTVLGLQEDFLQHEDRGPRVRKMRDERDSG